MHSRAKFNKILQRRLSPQRYEHSLHVEMRALHLAVKHRADPYLAGVAGLMHDICHDDAPAWQLRYIQSCGHRLEKEWEGHPQIWHALTGSLFLRRELEVREKPILLAVRYHTTGRAGMSQLEKVVFLADATSLDRNFDGVEALRAICDRSLDEGMRWALSHSVGKIFDGAAPLVRDAWEAYNEYVARPLLPGRMEPIDADVK